MQVFVARRTQCALALVPTPSQESATRLPASRKFGWNGALESSYDFGMMSETHPSTIGPAYLPDGSGPVEITIQGGRIGRVAPSAQSVARNRHVGPGLIDIQVNGYGGLSFTRSALTTPDVRKVVDLLAAEGVTRFVPTLITDAHSVYVDALGVLASACEQDARVRDAVICIHVEGPWISSEDGPRGAHPLAHTRPPNWDEFEAWQAAAGGRIGYVTLAPELDGAIAMIERLARDDIVVALAHTAATHEQISAAVDAGARLSTHLGNGSHKILDRHDNYIWAQAAEDRLTASFIADGHHLPAPALKCLIRAKTPKRSILTSDASPVAGLPPGEYDTFGVAVEIRPDGRLCLSGTPYLAGSAQSLWHGIATACRIADVSLAEAFEMAAAHPAALFGIGRDCGRIVAGQRADLVEFDWDPAGDTPPALRRTIAAGQVVHERTN